MKWLTDLLADIPLSVVLKEKFSIIELKFLDAEKKIALLEGEKLVLTEKVKNLEIQLLEAQKENEILKTQLRVNAESENLDSYALQVIGEIAKHEKLTVPELERQLTLSRTQIEYTTQNLIKHKILQCRASQRGSPTPYSLTLKGNKLALDNKLA